MDKSDVEMKGATDQLQDQNNEEVHPQNGCVDVQPLNNDDKLPHSATVQDTKPAELATQEALDGVTESKDKVDAAKNTESELQDPNSKDIVNGLEVTSGNVDQDQPLGEKTREDQHIKDSEVEKTPEEKVAVPAELTVEKASYNETGVNEEMKEIKDDEPSNGEVLASENVSMENEPKQSEKMAVLTSTLEDGVTQEPKLPEAEREGNDADHNTTEAIVDAPKANVKEDIPTTAAVDTNASSRTSLDEQKPTISPSMIRCPSTKSGGQGEESYKNMFNEIKMTGDENGTPQEQAAFIRVLENFYRERAMEFKAPRFYGQQLNCLKLWRSVIKLGGYDRVTGCKLWRQVGESFHPPKTCTTISWTFRIFYEKALLEYERRVTESGELQLPQFPASDLSSVDNEMQGSVFQASGSGRARRDSATRAMQGWHSRLLGNSEGGEQIMKDKNGNNMKREKTIKSIGSLKQKRPDEVEHPVKAARTEPSKQLVSSVVDAGPPADWVRINVRETKDCYEVYALVPGLLREEVRVQSDPAGRLVITGQPDQPDNPWGITAFKKVISLPGRIDPLHTSAVVSLHGRLFVRVPFE